MIQSTDRGDIAKRGERMPHSNGVHTVNEEYDNGLRRKKFRYKPNEQISPY